MKNLGTLLCCLAYLFGCSSATVKTIQLSDGNRGYDVNCLGNEAKCKERARILCESGKFRVHNIFDDSNFLEGAGLTMRMQCLEETANLEQCSYPGVNCVL